MYEKICTLRQIIINNYDIIIKNNLFVENSNVRKNHLKISNFYSPTYTNTNFSSLYTDNVDPILGTGSIWEIQIAYLLSKK